MSYRDVGPHERIDVLAQVQLPETCLNAQSRCAPVSVHFTRYSAEGLYPQCGWIEDLRLDAGIWGEVVGVLVSMDLTYAEARLTLDYEVLPGSEADACLHPAAVSRVSLDQVLDPS